jgi:hypothetical protein
MLVLDLGARLPKTPAERGRLEVADKMTCREPSRP